MAYQFTQDEIAQISAARDLCPLNSVNPDNPTTTGNWVPFYTTLFNILGQRIDSNTVTGNDLQDLINAKLWLGVAIHANGGDGMHSAFIRAFTNREGLLRRGSEFTTEEMQYASNGVALYLWNDLSKGINGLAWTVPSIANIAKSDASSIGFNLYGAGAIGQRLPSDDDTAITANAGWSGSLGFNLLGGTSPYESWRLIAGGDGGETRAATLNTLDDFKNILFAVDAYQYALQAGFFQGVLDLINATIDLFASLGGYSEQSQAFASLRAQANISKQSGDISPYLTALVARTPVIAPTVNLILNIGTNRFLDMLRGVVDGKVKIGETTEENFAVNAQQFFSGFTAEQLQNMNAKIFSNATGLGDLAQSDVNARAALAAMSLITVDVAPGVADRFAMY